MNTRFNSVNDLKTVDDIRECDIVPLLSAKYAELKGRITKDIILLAACAVRLTDLGYKLSEDADVIARLRAVDEGKMSAATYFKLLPVPKVVSLIGNMPLHAQAEIADGAPIPVAIPGKDGEPVIVKKPIFDMTQQERVVACDNGVLRKPADMKRIVKLRMQQKEIPPYRVAVNPGRLIVHKAGEYDLEQIIQEYNAAKKKSPKRKAG